MSNTQPFWGSAKGAILTGAVLGVVAALLVKLGNPPNMGMCVACFSRDTAGALGFHRAAPVQYIRPELAGLVLGSLLAALAFKEFKPRTGSAALLRFVLGLFAAIGTLVFLGCPWRAFLRLGGGDANALFGILGLVIGIAAGAGFMKMGYGLGRSKPAPAAHGWVMPALAVAAIALLLWNPQFGLDANKNPTGPIFTTPLDAKGPGAMRAPWYYALGLAALVGFLAQRSRFCTVGAFRNLILIRDLHLFWGVVALVAANVGMNLALGQFKWGFEGQPIAHTQTLWNILGMVLAGLAFTLAVGCPGRQFILAGEGDSDAAVFCLGLLAGTALAHNLSMASTPAGVGAFGPAGVIVGLVVCLIVGLTMREPQEA
ncbi:MAG: YedE family putative selenium transporter [Planctomycetota bacterium]|nr:YedE family putative selenium transporter [Planctomycetota bacterium]